jgi:HSP20 family protein
MRRQLGRTLKRAPILFNKKPASYRFFSTQAPKMSLLFPRFNEFSPLFRIADELDRAARSGPLSGSMQTNTRSFTPRFDVRETKEAYELHGELPGIEQSNVNIEWTDDNTLAISGHTEHTYTSGEEPRVTDTEDGSHYHKPSVEEEGEGTTKTGEKGQALTKTNEKKELATENDEGRPRFWVSERSYGSFHRSFQFPAAIDSDSVKASLKNGILEIVVPKKTKSREARKITIQ